MRALLEVFPEIEGHIMWKETASPQFIDALFNEMGNPIGVAQSIEQVGENRPPIVDPHIEGLYHCSADTGQHGIGGELAADAALRLFEILT
jgi:phytoene dehydrogenase-like protein